LEINPNVRWRWEGDVVLLSTLATLNRTAGEILELCSTGHTIDEIIEITKGTYPEVDQSKLKTDIEKTIEKFKRWNIISDSSSERMPMRAFAMEHIRTHFNNTLSAPVRVAFELTHACQADCVHCYIKRDTPYENELTTTEWKTLIDRLATAGVFGLSYTGGEPTLYSDLEELVQHASSRNIHVTVASNGYLLPPERIQSLVDSGLKGLYISLDGVDASTHDRLRQLPGLYERVIEALEYAVDTPLDPVALITLTTENRDQIPDIMALAHEMGIRRISVMNLVCLGRGEKNRYLELSIPQYVNVLTSIHQKDQELPNLGVLYPDVPAALYGEAIGLTPYQNLKKVGKVGSCGAGILTIAVNPEGYIKPCDVSLDIRLGNVRTDDIIQTWREDPLLNQLRTITKSEIAPCSQCQLHSICAAGCRVLPSQVSTGEPGSSDPMCMKCFETYGGETHSRS
jgi:radical SAM protein with 4Fe4S-binding SPASM domain